MSNKDNHTNSIIPHTETRSTFQHLKPLSIYSHMVCHKQYSPGSPLCNIKVNITNKTAGGYKRRLEDSCLDETCKTPVKKPCFYRSCSPDQGCVVDSLDFLPGVQGSTPIQPLIISKDVTPPRSEVVQPVTPVMSTPVSKCMQNKLVHTQEFLPSPIPVLNWDRDVPSSEISLHASLNFDICNSVNVSLTGGSGKGKMRVVSNVCVPVCKSKCSSVTEAATVITTKDEGVSVSQLATSNFEVTTENEESFESSLPLQVQVKSKVVVPETTKTVCQSAANQSERKPELEINRRTRSLIQRPVVFHSEEDWKRAKKTYVESVKRHMETNGAGNGVMMELHHLMNTVAGQRHGQKPGHDAGHWQHPSDFTRRNYHVGGPLLSLSEWQKRNNLTLRRFATVPDIFRRSPWLFHLLNGENVQSPHTTSASHHSKSDSHTVTQD